MEVLRLSYLETEFRGNQSYPKCIKLPLVAFYCVPTYQINTNGRPFKQQMIGLRPWVLVHFFLMAQQPLIGQELLIIEASRPLSDTPQTVGLLWTSDQPDTETST